MSSQRPSKRTKIETEQVSRDKSTTPESSEQIVPEVISTASSQDMSDNGGDVIYSDGLPDDIHMRRRNPGHPPSSWRSCRGGGEGCIIHGSEKNWMGLIFVNGFGCPCRVHQSMCPPPWGSE